MISRSCGLRACAAGRRLHARLSTALAAGTPPNFTRYEAFGRNADLTRIFPVLVIEQDGTLSDSSITYQTLRTVYGLTMSDVAEVNETQNDDTSSAIVSPRPKAIVLHISHFKVVLTAERALFFDAHRQVVKHDTAVLAEEVRSMQIATCVELPFELRVLDMLLASAMHKYRNRMQCFNEVVPGILHQLELTSSKGEAVDNTLLMGVMDLKKSLALFSDSAGTVRNVLADITASTDDMLHLLLTARIEHGGELPPAEYHDDVELLLEHHYRGMSSVVSEVERMRGATESTIFAMQLRLDSFRNRILRLELYLAAAAVSCAIPAAMAGVFGMNLTSGVEAVTPLLFWGVAATGISAGGIVFQRSRSVAAMGANEGKRLTAMHRVNRILRRLDDVQDVALDYVSHPRGARSSSSSSSSTIEEEHDAGKGELPLVLSDGTLVEQRWEKRRVLREEGFDFAAFSEMIEAHSAQTITVEETEVLFRYFDRNGTGRLGRTDIAHFVCQTYFQQTEERNTT